MSNSIPLIYDVTLRDGSHANKHSFTAEFCSKYIEYAYKAGLRYIEVGHGNGLGGNSLHIGMMNDEHCLRAITSKTAKYQDLKIGVHVIPGLATFDDLDKALEYGVNVFRIASHCTEADTTETYIEHVANQDKEVWGLLMMSHMIKPDYLAREAKMKLWGLKNCISGFSWGTYACDGEKYMQRNARSITGWCWFSRSQ